MICFTKMHGLANDYIYVNCFREKLDGLDVPDLCRRMSHRHTGIGSDGLILITPPQAGVAADARMEMYNADGSRGEMCGNGIRCVAKYVLDHGIVSHCGAGVSPALAADTAAPQASHPSGETIATAGAKQDIRIQTDRGVLTLTAFLQDGKVDRVRVNMGPPILQPANIPVQYPGDRCIQADLPIADRWCENPLTHPLQITCVSMGNPHAVTFLDDVKAFDLSRIGPLVERHPIFPNRVNFHVVQVHSPTEATMRTWERGSGITQACGTGACAVVVAGILENRLDRRVLVHLPGGDLEIEWPEADPTHPGPVLMTGPAVEVFTGQWP